MKKSIIFILKPYTLNLKLDNILSKHMQILSKTLMFSRSPLSFSSPRVCPLPFLSYSLSRIPTLPLLSYSLSHIPTLPLWSYSLSHLSHNFHCCPIHCPTFAPCTKNSSRLFIYQLSFQYNSFLSFILMIYQTNQCFSLDPHTFFNPLHHNDSWAFT